MLKKRWIVIGALLGCICAACAISAVLPPPSGVTKANFDRIRIGMSEVEVEQILGSPEPIIDGPRKMIKYEVWTPHYGRANVFFDEDGLVYDKTWSGWIPPTFFQRLEVWIKGPVVD